MPPFLTTLPRRKSLCMWQTTVMASLKERTLLFEPLFDDKEVDTVVSFHVASQEANAVIDAEEAVRILLTWKEARKSISSVAVGQIRSVRKRHRQTGPNLEQLRKRTRCCKCKRVGHFQSRLSGQVSKHTSVKITRSDCNVEDSA